MTTKLYGKWIYCIKENCPESKYGKCERAVHERNQDVVYGYPADFPTDGKCLFPKYIEYDKEWEALGAYETEEVR